MKLLTIEQVAELAQFHPDVVRGHIRAGNLHAVKPKGSSHWRIAEADYLAWLQPVEAKNGGKAKRNGTVRRPLTFGDGTPRTNNSGGSK